MSHLRTQAEDTFEPFLSVLHRPTFRLSSRPGDGLINCQVDCGLGQNLELCQGLARVDQVRSVQAQVLVKRCYIERPHDLKKQQNV